MGGRRRSSHGDELNGPNEISLAPILLLLIDRTQCVLDKREIGRFRVKLKKKKKKGGQVRRSDALMFLHFYLMVPLSGTCLQSISGCADAVSVTARQLSAAKRTTASGSGPGEFPPEEEEENVLRSRRRSGALSMFGFCRVCECVVWRLFFFSLPRSRRALIESPVCGGRCR